MYLNKSALSHCLILLVLIMSTYIISINNSFHFDDHHLIMENNYLNGLNKIPSLFVDKKAGSAKEQGWGNYRPMVLLTYSLNKNITGSSPAGFIITNILLHFLTSLLVYRLSLVLTNSRQISFMASSLFAVTPANNEVVNYITARSGLLATIFYLAAIISFIRFRSLEKTGPKTISMLMFLIFTICSVLSKEIGITIPAIAILYDIHFQKNRFRNNWKSYMIFTLPAAIALLLKLGTTLNQLDFSRLTLLPIIAMKHLLFFFLPYPLNIDHNIVLGRSIIDPYFILASLSIISITYLVIKYGRHNRRANICAFAITWCFITLSPVLFLPLLTKSALFQENRGYLTNVGLVILTAVILQYVFIKIKAGTHRLELTLAAILLIFICINLNRNIDWKDEIKLWNSTLKYNKQSFQAHHTLGLEYQNMQEPNKAIEEYQRAVKIKPDYFLSYNNIGKAYKDLGNLDKAVEYYKKALRLNSNYALAHFNIGNIYLEQKDYKKAELSYKRAIEINPTYGNAHLYLGLSHTSMGNNKAAVKEFKEVLKYTENPEAYANLGVAQIRLGNIEGAKQSLLNALKLKENYPPVHFTLGMIYQAGNEYEKAIKHLRISIEQHGNAPRALFSLGNLLIERKRAGEGVAYLKQFVKSARTKPEFAKLVQLARQQIALFKPQRGSREK